MRRIEGDESLGVRLYVPIPITTKKPVRNLPKSITPDPLLSIKSSGLLACPQIQFGRGAITYVATTRRVR
jgi:hypothetical protein